MLTKVSKFPWCFFWSKMLLNITHSLVITIIIVSIFLGFDHFWQKPLKVSSNMLSFNKILS